MSGWNYCRDGGLLVSSRTPIPDDQGEFYGTSRLDLVPCSHLVCSSCGEVVRSVANRQVPGGTLPSDLYDVSNWRRSDLLTTTDLPARAYACRCSFMNVVSDTLIVSLASGAPLGWGCAGHPTVRGAFVLDGVSVEQGPALDAAVVAALDGRPPGALDAPWATHGAIWVLRLWGRLRGNPLQDADPPGFIMIAGRKSPFASAALSVHPQGEPEAEDLIDTHQMDAVPVPMPMMNAPALARARTTWPPPR